MKISPFAVAAVLFASGLAPLCSAPAQAAPAQAAPAQASPAPNYVSKTDGFSIYMPGKPTLASHTAMGPTGTPMNVTYVSVKGPQVAYVVIPMKLPGTPRGASIEQFLGGVQRGFTMSTSAKLISSKKISLQGAPGREVLVQVGASLMRARFFVKGSRSYQIVAVAPKANLTKNSAQVDQVLNSFRILT